MYMIFNTMLLYLSRVESVTTVQWLTRVHLWRELYSKEMELLELD